MSALSLADIEALAAGRLGVIDVACPVCGPAKRSVLSQRRRVLRIWHSEESFATFKCQRCDLQGYARGDRSSHVGGACPTWKSPRKIGTPDPSADSKREKARWLWSRRLQIEGSIAERYLREAEAILASCPPRSVFCPRRERGRRR